LTITDEAARLLVELTGEDTATLLGEARKAALAKLVQQIVDGAQSQW